jgi:hypothetical protein
MRLEFPVRPIAIIIAKPGYTIYGTNFSELGRGGRGSPVLVVLFNMSYPNVHATVVLFPLPCPFCHVLAILSPVSFPGCTILTVFSGCPVPAVLLHQPYSPAHLSPQSLAVMSWLTCLGCPVQHHRRCHVLTLPS